MPKSISPLGAEGVFVKPIRPNTDDGHESSHHQQNPGEDKCIVPLGIGPLGGRGAAAVGALLVVSMPPGLCVLTAKQARLTSGVALDACSVMLDAL